MSLGSGGGGGVRIRSSREGKVGGEILYDEFTKVLSSEQRC
jgi:hypothetical protein